MSQKRRRGSARRTTDQNAAYQQPEWHQPLSPQNPIQLYSDAQIEQIHHTSLRILDELGIELMSEIGRNLFEAAGARVDHDSGLVKVDAGTIMDLVSKAPSSFSLTSRNREKKLEFGGRNMVFGLVAGPPNVHDMIKGRRSGNYDDYCDFIRLAHYFNAIHMIGNQVVAPIELPANSRHLDTYFANLFYSDRTFHLSAIGRGRVMDGVKMAAIARGSSLAEMKLNPGVMTIISVNSPRKFDDAMAEGLIAMAEYGQPVSITPFTLMGAMTPVTLPAALAQQNAEALFGIALAQLVTPGTPVMYGAFTSNVDMKSGAPAFGTPENTKANIISGQLARRYNLPYRTSNANASNAVDAQAAYETMMSTWGAVLGGANIIYHAAGWMEGGLTASFEKLILDVEILQHMAEFLKPDEFREDDLGFDAIARVPSGGHFFGDPHTLERYSTAFYQPMLSNWQNFENWQDAGSKDATMRATEIWQTALKDYELPDMPSHTEQELKAYMVERRSEIGHSDP